MKNVLVWVIIYVWIKGMTITTKKCCKHFVTVNTIPINTYNDWSVIYFFLEFQNPADLVKHYKDRQTQLRSKETTSEKKTRKTTSSQHFCVSNITYIAFCYF